MKIRIPGKITVRQEKPDRTFAGQEGFIPQARQNGQRGLEQLSNLEQQTVLLMKNEGFRVFNFTSSNEGEGVSSVAGALARLMAGKSMKILLVDANCSRPVQHTKFNVPLSPGFSDALAAGSVSGAVHEFHSGGLEILPSGNGAYELSSAAGHEKLSLLMSSVRAHFDCVIIDSPPLLASSDSLAMAIASDVTFLIIQANRTPWEVANRSKKLLEEKACRIGGVVLNRTVHVIPSWIYKRL